MKDKHIRVRIEQCLLLAKASNCPRRSFGALLLDPERNVVLADGYNGAPRGGGSLCGGHRCLRDGLAPDQVEIRSFGDQCAVHIRSGQSWESALYPDGRVLGSPDQADALKARLLKENLPVASGTRVEIGCVHAEMNVICNAAAGGVKSAGAWLIVTGEPCLQCAKLVHHAGIVHVIVVAGGYAGANGLEYLREHKVRVTEVDGPQDPRLGKAVQSGMCTSSSL